MGPPGLRLSPEPSPGRQWFDPRLVGFPRTADSETALFFHPLDSVGNMRRVLRCALLAVALTAPTSGVADASLAGDSAAATGVQASVTFHLTPDRPGSVQADLTVRGLSAGQEVSLDLEDETVVSAEGFRRTDEHTYVWDGETDTPILRYREPVNETDDGEGFGGGGVRAVDAGSWALFRADEPVVLVGEGADASPPVERDAADSW